MSLTFLFSNIEAGLQKRPEHCLARVSGYFASLQNWYDDSYPDFFELFRADLREYLRVSNVPALKRCILQSIGKMERRDYFISSYMLADPDLKEIEPDPSLAVETGKILLRHCKIRMSEECNRFLHNLLAGLAINSYRIGNHSEAKKYKSEAYEWSRKNGEDLGARSEEEWNILDGI
ncbi:hypothetical protein A0128_04425 [Leptospira tipperaryensis]|uniref:Uncharacterized protein n=1 Tax=Leptospira tipperaryensis TaxID=2564040 RepID=A0A1D7V249_9LEPT|nr:hypothetical protein A0128_04425 [Leptospira tipperaryensis]